MGGERSHHCAMDGVDQENMCRCKDFKVSVIKRELKTNFDYTFKILFIKQSNNDVKFTKALLVMLLFWLQSFWIILMLS